MFLSFVKNDAANIGCLGEILLYLNCSGNTQECTHNA